MYIYVRRHVRCAGSITIIGQAASTVGEKFYNSKRIMSLFYSSFVGTSFFHSAFLPSGFFFLGKKEGRVKESLFSGEKRRRERSINTQQRNGERGREVVAIESGSPRP